MVSRKTALSLVSIVLMSLNAQIITEQDSISSTKQDSSSGKSISIEMSNNIKSGISLQDRQRMADELLVLLADNFVVYTKLLNFHWNIQGMLFLPLHEFFGKLYNEAQETNDTLAERIRALGGRTPASLYDFLQLTQIKEHRGGFLTEKEMVRILLEDFETIIRSIRKAVDLSAQHNDMASNNMLAGMLEKLEKDAWMLRSHLQ